MSDYLIIQVSLINRYVARQLSGMIVPGRAGIIAELSLKVLDEQSEIVQ